MSVQQTNSCSLFLPESGSLSLKHKLIGKKKEVFQNLKFFETQEDILISSKQLEVKHWHGKEMGKSVQYRCIGCNNHNSAMLAHFRRWQGAGETGLGHFIL